MNPIFLLITATAAIGLAGLLFWSVRGARHDSSRRRRSLDVLTSAPRHLTHMAQLRQATDKADLRFLATTGGRALASRVRSDRRRVLVLYLEAIRSDFEDLLQIARVIAVLSPEVSGSHEYARLRLSLVFRWRFELIRARILLGGAEMPRVAGLGEMVTALALEMQQSMAQLGERAALATELSLHSEP